MGRCVLSIDPGIDWGYAVWNSHGTHFFKLESPIKSGVLWASKTITNWHEKLDVACRQFDTLLKDLIHPLERVIIEEPAYFQSAGGGVAARRGDLVKLALVTGAFAGIANCKYMAVIELVPVTTWKGQLPKEVVIKRIREKLPKIKGVTSHAWDAVGIGLHAKGHFE